MLMICFMLTLNIFMYYIYIVYSLVYFSLVSLVYLFIHLVTHVTLNTSISVYNLYITKHNL